VVAAFGFMAGTVAVSIYRTWEEADDG